MPFGIKFTPNQKKFVDILSNLLLKTLKGKTFAQIQVADPLLAQAILITAQIFRINTNTIDFYLGFLFHKLPNKNAVDQLVKDDKNRKYNKGSKVPLVDFSETKISVKVTDFEAIIKAMKDSTQYDHLHFMYGCSGSGEKFKTFTVCVGVYHSVGEKYDKPYIDISIRSTNIPSPLTDNSSCKTEADNFKDRNYLLKNGGVTGFDKEAPGIIHKLALVEGWITILNKKNVKDFYVYEGYNAGKNYTVLIFTEDSDLLTRGASPNNFDYFDLGQACCPPQ